MNRAGHQLFPGARLAEDEHRRIAPGHRSESLAETYHRWRRADQDRRRIGRTELRTRRGEIAAERPRIVDATEANEELVEIERLGEVIVRTGLQRFDRVVHGAERRHQDHFGRRRCAPRRLKDRPPVPFRQAHVGDDDVEHLRRDPA